MLLFAMGRDFTAFCFSPFVAILSATGLQAEVCLL
jgi:hypothetical protein